jgi:predicted RNA-binding Zn-ribbon protein involved in translation (DUF1610 family)
MTTKQFDCPQCSAQLEYDPEVGKPKCPYCGYEEEVVFDASEKSDAIEELDFHEYLSKAAAEEDFEETITVTCEACYASTTLDSTITSSECPFCGTMIVTQGESKRMIKPKSLLAFTVTTDNAFEMWQKWIQGLWFAPNRLKKEVKHAENLNGIYIPHWTYDSETHSRYAGKRGDYYWEKRDGKKVRKTKWSSTKGQVDVSFDDVLIIASDSVPKPFAKKLQPWDLENLVPYSDQYLSGFRAESYKTDLESGFNEAKTIMDSEIYHVVEDDIGGDTQVVLSVNTNFEDIKFKHILLPIWISAYRFNSKVYQFLVNGRSGKVIGQRPYSWVKISLAILAALSVVGAAGAIGYYYQ